MATQEPVYPQVCPPIGGGPSTGETTKPALTQQVHCSRCGRDFQLEIRPRRGLRDAVVVKVCNSCRGKCKDCLENPERNPIYKAGKCHVCYYAGKTFTPLQRVIHNGKTRYLHDSAKHGNQVPWHVAEKFRLLEIKDGQPTVEEFYSPDNVKTAQETLAGMSVRDIRKKWRISQRSAWKGKKAVLELPLEADKEAAAIREQWQLSATKPGIRKCAHGVWQHSDDRGEFSRHCTACNPHATSKYHVSLPDQPVTQRPSDQELVRLYEAGDTPKEIAKRIGMSTKLVRKYLRNAGVQLRPEDRGKGRKVVHKTEASENRYYKQRSVQKEIVDAGGIAANDWDAPELNATE
jgi:hypothetical protein